MGKAVPLAFGELGGSYNQLVAALLVLFDGLRGHEVDDFQGERFSVVWFNAGKFWTMGRDTKDFLRQCGFGATENEDLGHVMKLLPPARGYSGRKCKSLTSMFGVVERRQPAQVMQWRHAVDAKEVEQSQKLLDGLTTELEAFVRAKEACDAEVHARNSAGEHEDASEQAEQQKQFGALDSLFAKAAAVKDSGKKEDGALATHEPASPLPTSRTADSLGVELSSEKRRAPLRSFLPVVCQVEVHRCCRWRLRTQALWMRCLHGWQDVMWQWSGVMQGNGCRSTSWGRASPSLVATTRIQVLPLAMSSWLL